MLENVKRCGYIAPTPIQAYTIPAVLLGHDVVACAQTGSFLKPADSEYVYLLDRQVPERLRLSSFQSCLS